MRALSLWQPWASAVANGQKGVETRHWQTAHRGELAIHAAKRWTADEREHWDSLRELAPAEWPILPPLGAIVALVDLVAIKPTEALRTTLPGEELSWGNYGDGRFGWELDNVRPLREPVLTVGRQSIWRLPEDLAARVRELAS